MDMQKTPEDPAEDWLETYATEVHDGAIGIKDAVDRIIETLREGKPIAATDLEEAQQGIEELHGSMKILEEELKKLHVLNK